MQIVTVLRLIKMMDVDKHWDSEGEKDSDVDDGDYDCYDRLTQLC